MNLVRRNLSLNAQWLKWEGRFNHNVPSPNQLGTGEAFNAFVEFIASDRRDQHLDDIRHIVYAFCRQQHRLVDLYHELLDEFAIKIAFHDFTPVITGCHGAFENWATLTELFDPDIFIILSYLTQSSSTNIEELIHWGTTCTTGDADLLRLFHRGLSDIHLHAGSLTSIAIQWRMLLLGPDRMGIDLYRLRRYRQTKQDDRLLKNEVAMIQAAINVWSDESINRTEPPNSQLSLAALKKFRKNISHAKAKAIIATPFDDAPITVPINNILLPERQFITEAFAYLMAQSKQTADSENLLYEAMLDKYLYAKNMFRYHHLQPELDTNPGLFAFKNYMNAPRPIKPARSHLSKNPRILLHQSIGPSLRAYLDSTNIERLELRMRPERKYTDYVKLIRAFATVIAEIYGQQEHFNIDIRLAIQFSRSLSEGTTIRPSQELKHTKLLTSIDRGSAALSLFRKHGVDVIVEGGKTCTSWISRIDLSGEERGSPPHYFAPYFRLLRGDQSYHNIICLEGFEQYYQNWKELIRHHDLSKMFGASKLGATCHAGEDYFTLIDGLWSIDSAIETLQLQAGEGLGHCLALGHNTQDCYKQINPSLKLPADIQFDSLLWCWNFCQQKEFLQCATVNKNEIQIILSHLESWLIKEAHHLFVPPNSSQHVNSRDLEIFFHFYGSPIPAPTNTLNDENLRIAAGCLDTCKQFGEYELMHAYQFWCSRWTTPQLLARSNDYVPIAPIQFDLIPIIKDMQSYLIEKIIHKGLVIETNPSSNRRMHRFERLSDLPIVAIIKNKSKRPRITICTDNPGVYDTRVENEYALLFEALTASETGIHREEALDILEKIRKCGMTEVQWPL